MLPLSNDYCFSNLFYHGKSGLVSSCCRGRYPSWPLVFSSICTYSHRFLVCILPLLQFYLLSLCHSGLDKSISYLCCCCCSNIETGSCIAQASLELMILCASLNIKSSQIGMWTLGSQPVLLFGNAVENNRGRWNLAGGWDSWLDSTELFSFCLSQTSVMWLAASCSCLPIFPTVMEQHPL